MGPDLAFPLRAGSRPPTLALQLTTTNLLLTIRGDVGRLHHALRPD